LIRARGVELPYPQREVRLFQDPVKTQAEISVK